MIKIIDISKKYLILPNSLTKRLSYFFKIIINSDVKTFYSKELNIRSFYALKSINAIIKKGENIGIFGLNGSGKSTLLKVLMGSLSFQEGSHNIDYNDIDLIDNTRVQLLNDSTILQAIESNLIGFTDNEINKLSYEIINFFDFEIISNKKISTLSTGMKNRLAFGIALISKKRILAIDEVLGAGDPYWNEKCLQWIKKLSDKNKIFLMTSHDTQLLQKFCKKGLWLDQGNIKSFGKIEEVSKEYETYSMSISFDGITSKNNIENNKSSDKNIKALNHYRVNSQFELKIEKIFFYNKDDILLNNSDKKNIKINNFPKKIILNYFSNKEKTFWPTFLITFWGFDGTRLFTIQNKSFKLNAKKNLLNQIEFVIPEFKLSNLKMYITISLFDTKIMRTSNDSLTRQDMVYKFCIIDIKANKFQNIKHPFLNTQAIFAAY